VLDRVQLFGRAQNSAETTDLPEVDQTKEALDGAGVGTEMSGCLRPRHQLRVIQNFGPVAL